MTDISVCVPSHVHVDKINQVQIIGYCLATSNPTCRLPLMLVYLEMHHVFLLLPVFELACLAHGQTNNSRGIAALITQAVFCSICVALQPLQSKSI